MSENKGKKPSKAEMVKELVKQFTAFRELENPIKILKDGTEKIQWIKQDIDGIKGAQLCKTSDGNLLLNVKMKGQRYGLFFDIIDAFREYHEIIDQKARIEAILEAIMKVNGTVSSNSNKVLLKI